MKYLALLTIITTALIPGTLNLFISQGALSHVAYAVDEENEGGGGNDGGNEGSGGNDTGNEGTGGNIPTIENPIGPDSIQELLAVILSAIVQIAIPFLVLAVMWVGFLFVAARGNPEKLSKAKQALFFTLIGALIILGAQTLATVLSGTIEQLTEQ